MLPKKLQKYLEDNKVKFEIMDHKVVYTAFDAAQTMKVKLNEIAKALLIKFNKPFIDGQKPYAVAIVGADKNIDLKKLAKTVSDWAIKLNKELRLKKPAKGKKPLVDIYNKVSKIVIPKEKEIKDKFRGKPGAMPAFGSLYKLPVFVDKGFLKNKQAVFPGGSFTQSLKMKVKDFAELEKVLSGNFAVAKKFKKPVKGNKQKRTAAKQTNKKAKPTKTKARGKKNKKKARK